MKRETRRDSSGEEQDVTPARRRAIAEHFAENQPGSFQYDNLGPGAIVAACAKVYADEYARLLQNRDVSYDAAVMGAGNLWRGVLPDIVDHRTTMGYIACIAWGSKMRLLTPTEAKTMMFMAQTQLTVMKAAPGEPPEKTPEPNQSGRLFGTLGQVSMEPK